MRFALIFPQSLFETASCCGNRIASLPILRVHWKSLKWIAAQNRFICFSAIKKCKFVPYWGASGGINEWGWYISTNLLLHKMKRRKKTKNAKYYHWVWNILCKRKSWRIWTTGVLPLHKQTEIVLNFLPPPSLLLVLLLWFLCCLIAACFEAYVRQGFNCTI